MLHTPHDIMLHYMHASLFSIYLSIYSHATESKNMIQKRCYRKAEEENGETLVS